MLRGQPHRDGVEASGDPDSRWHRGRGEPSVSAALPALFPACAPAEAGDALQGRQTEPESTLTAAAKDLWLKKPGVGMQEMLSTIHAQWPQQARIVPSQCGRSAEPAISRVCKFHDGRFRVHAGVVHG
jgi:hypothetical protein